jgi:hypothetical protein
VLIEQGVQGFKKTNRLQNPNQKIKQEEQRDDIAYNVAWANLRDWTLAQMALLETEMVTIPQVFLPFATDSKGETLFDKVSKSNFLLGDGN